MADYFSTNAYSRSNASSSNNNNNSTNDNGYYSSNSNNDFYSNPYGQPNQQSTTTTNTSSTQQSQQPSLFSNNGINPMPSLFNPSTMATAAQFASTMATAASVSNNGNNNMNPNNNNPNNTNEAIYNIGLQMGHTFLDKGTARLVPGLETFMKTLRIYFAVDNGYVKRKMLRVLCSFFCKNWSRIPNNEMPATTMNHTHNGHAAPSSKPTNTTPYALPINDDNAPDLYIPFMSLITYVLLCALCYGTAGQFDPEVIINVTSKCIMIQIIEVCLFKFGIYMMIGGSSSTTTFNPTSQESSSTTMSFLDLLSFTGYKYLALTCNMLIGLTVTLMRFGSGNGSSISSSTTSTLSNTVDGVDVDAVVADAAAAIVDDEVSTTEAASKIAAAAVNAATNAASAAAAAAAETDSNGYGGHKGYYIMFLWTASSICYFMLKTMANNIPYTYQQQQGLGSGPKREFVILGFAVSQFFTLWFLGQTKFLN